MLRRSLTATLSLLPLPVLAHPPRQPDKAESASIVEEIKVVRDKLAKAVTAKDARTLRSIYADAFTHTHESGKMDDKEARIASALAGEPMIENAPATDLSYRVFAGPTAIVTGKTTLPNAGDPSRRDVRWVAVYVTGRDGWLLAVSQATRLPA
ncbi:MAG: nuclear transport factor 2 family protein [Reyranella sp.]|nr:nuclear transport factor 2 family protein [Reyranella sp.]